MNNKQKLKEALKQLAKSDKSQLHWTKEDLKGFKELPLLDDKGNRATFLKSRTKLGGNRKQRRSL